MLLRKALRSPQVWIGALLVAVALLARLLPGPRTIDDAFITFRYARNLLAGNGFVYNPGEAVLGTTTPLYTLLMAGLGVPWGVNAPFPWLALVVNALADAATCLLLVWLGKRIGARWAGWAAAAVWAVAPFSVTFVIGGLETSLYVLLLTGCAAAALAEKRVAAALLAALALLTRPDALILLGPLALERAYAAFFVRPRQTVETQNLASLPQDSHDPVETQDIASPARPEKIAGGGNVVTPATETQYLASLPRSREKLRWAEAAAFCIPVLAWGVFAALSFGSPLPHSILAKAVAYHLQPADALVRLIQHYATPFLEQNLLGTPIAIAIGIVLYPVLCIIGTLAAFRKAPRLLPWLLYPWLYFVTFALPNPLIFRWYLTPPLPAYFLLILFGLERVLSQILRVRPAVETQYLASPARPIDQTAGAGNVASSAPETHPGWTETQNLASLRRPRRRGFAVLAVLLVYPLIFTLSDWTLHPDHGPDRPAPQMAYIQLELLYRQAAAIIAPRMDSHSLLAAGDVGVLGYYTPGRILDTVGLNSPVSSGYYPLPPEDYVINYAIPAQLILDQRPDFVVILEVYGRETLLKDARFLAQYRLQQKIDTDMYGSDGLLIFQRLPG